MSHFEQYGFMPTFFSQIPCVIAIWVTSSVYTHSSCKSDHGIMMLFLWKTFHWMSGCTSWSKPMNALPIKTCLKTRELALPSHSCMWSAQLLCPELYQESYTVNFEQPTFTAFIAWTCAVPTETVAKPLYSACLGGAPPWQAIFGTWIQHTLLLNGETPR